MSSTPTLLRRAEHEALQALTLSGTVLDLGGEKGASYLSFIKGSFTVTALNMAPAASPDIIHDLEQPLPLPDASYDNVMLINVLEHIYEYRALLSEAARVLRPGGTIAIIVPFLFPIHPSPRDYWRFTAATLRRELEQLGLSHITIVPLGSGVFAARYVLLDRLMPGALRFIGYYTLRYVTYALDYLFSSVARLLRKGYSPSEYALGYCVTAIQP